MNGLVRTAEGLSFDGPGLSELELADTVIVPACADLQGNPPLELLEALRKAYARGARIASICTGAFTLAAAGLLDGRRATTHWMHAAELTERWPAVQLDPNVLYTQDERIFTSAGECAGLDLCLHLVRLDHGSHIANTLARRMVIPPHREGGQAQYIDQRWAVTSHRRRRPEGSRWAAGEARRGQRGCVLAREPAGTARGYRPRWGGSGPGLVATAAHSGRLRPRLRKQAPG